jgi:uncharacterized protein (DUF885 family)
MEGWPLYCEWLAKEAAWYDKDPFGDLGRLRDELFRAVRLVVDTGITQSAGPANRRSPTCARKPGWAKKKLSPK